MPETLKKTVSQPELKAAPQPTCQICGKTGGVVYDPEKAPPNRLCYRCASEYELQDADDE